MRLEAAPPPVPGGRSGAMESAGSRTTESAFSDCLAAHPAGSEKAVAEPASPPTEGDTPAAAEPTAGLASPAPEQASQRGGGVSTTAEASADGQGTAPAGKAEAAGRPAAPDMAAARAAGRATGQVTPATQPAGSAPAANGGSDTGPGMPPKLVALNADTLHRQSLATAGPQVSAGSATPLARPTSGALAKVAADPASQLASSLSLTAPAGGSSLVTAAPTAAFAQGAVAAGIATADQLAAQLQLQFRDGVGKATVRLHPESLGELQVSVETVEQQVRVVLAARQPASLDWLQHSLPRLQSALDSAGFSKVEVDIQQQFGDGDKNPSSGQSRPGMAPPRPGLASAPASHSGLGPAPEAATLTSLAVVSGLDTWA